MELHGMNKNVKSRLGEDGGVDVAQTEYPATWGRSDDYGHTPVLTWNEPPNQTGGKVTFRSKILQRKQQLRLWVLWVTDGDIQPFPTLAKHFKGFAKHFKKGLLFKVL
jgi:hypothetical protein